jgi:hypothetical protein
MKKKFIRSDRLSGAIKLFLKDLIDRGNCFVDVTDFSAELHKIVDELPREAAIEWNDVEKVGLPLVSDEYIVMIAYAEKPTVLYFDAEDGVFFEEKDDEDVAYKVTHWAEMPEAPYV